jgi:DNA polymerase-3 subunit epsilon
MTQSAQPLVPSLKGAWREAEMVVIDFETTATDPKEARIVEVGAVLIEQGQVTDTLSKLVNPGIPIPEGAKAVHGITNEEVAKAGAFSDVLADLYTMCECAMPVAYNEPYDRTVLHSELDRIGDHNADIPAFDRKQVWIDPLVWVREFDKYVKGKGRHKLSVTAARYGIKLDNAHRAVADAEATAKVLWHLAPQIKAKSLSDLLETQKRLAALQEAEFAKWRARKQRQEQQA